MQQTIATIREIDEKLTNFFKLTTTLYSSLKFNQLKFDANRLLCDELLTKMCTVLIEIPVHSSVYSDDLITR